MSLNQIVDDHGVGGARAERKMKYGVVLIPKG